MSNNHDGPCPTCGTRTCPDDRNEVCCLPCYARTLAGLFDRRLELRKRWERESNSRQSLAHTGFLLDQNSRDIADHPELAALLERCSCGCSRDMHIARSVAPVDCRTCRRATPIPAVNCGDERDDLGWRERRRSDQ